MLCDFTHIHAFTRLNLLFWYQWISYNTSFADDVNPLSFLHRDFKSHKMDILGVVYTNNWILVCISLCMLAFMWVIFYYISTNIYFFLFVLILSMNYIQVTPIVSAANDLLVNNLNNFKVHASWFYTETDGIMTLQNLLIYDLKYVWHELCSQNKDIWALYLTCNLKSDSENFGDNWKYFRLAL